MSHPSIHMDSGKRGWYLNEPKLVSSPIFKIPAMGLIGMEAPASTGAELEELTHESADQSA